MADMIKEYEPGDIVSFNDFGRRTLDLLDDIQMVVMAKLATHKGCYICELRDKSDAQIIKENYHFSSFNLDDCTMHVHRDFLRFVAPPEAASFDPNAFDILLSTV